MTEISEAAKAKARALWEQATKDRLTPNDTLARFIQQVNDAAMIAKVELEGEKISAFYLDPFILREPVDPADLIADDIGYRRDSLRETLVKFGLKIVKDET